MPKSEYYNSMVLKYDAMIQEAERTYNMTRARRDRDRIEYLKGRRKRYKL